MHFSTRTSRMRLSGQRFPIIYNFKERVTGKFRESLFSFEQSFETIGCVLIQENCQLAAITIALEPLVLGPGAIPRTSDGLEAICREICKQYSLAAEVHKLSHRSNHSQHHNRCHYFFSMIGLV